MLRGAGGFSLRRNEAPSLTGDLLHRTDYREIAVEGIDVVALQHEQFARAKPDKATSKDEAAEPRIDHVSGSEEGSGLEKWSSSVVLTAAAPDRARIASRASRQRMQCSRLRAIDPYG
jgi:hypothetical protein